MAERDISVQVMSDPRLLKPIRGLVRNYTSSMGFDEERTDAIVLAVDEACTNAIRHAYGGNAKRKICLSLHADKRWMEIEVKDDGKPAPKDCIPVHPQQPPSMEALKPGGLGVQLIFDVFDDVVFCPGAKRGNLVLMRARRPKNGKG